MYVYNVTFTKHYFCIKTGYGENND